MLSRVDIRVLLPVVVALLCGANVARAAIITTDDGLGADARVRRSQSTANYGSESFVAVQNSTTTNARKTYLRFDLSLLGGLDVIAAELQLTPTNDFPVGTGLTIDLFGLNNLNSGESWSEAGTTGITWGNAPANNTGSNTLVTSDATSLGSFVFTSDFEDGVPISFSSTAIRDFINADTNGVVTFILTGPQPAGAMNYTFASKENVDGDQFPTLQVSPVPEPSSFLIMGVLASSFCGFWEIGRLRVRKRAATKA